MEVNDWSGVLRNRPRYNMMSEYECKRAWSTATEKVEGAGKESQFRLPPPIVPDKDKQRFKF